MIWKTVWTYLYTFFHVLFFPIKSIWVLKKFEIFVGKNNLSWINFDTYCQVKFNPKMITFFLNCMLDFLNAASFLCSFFFLGLVKKKHLSVWVSTGEVNGWGIFSSHGGNMQFSIGWLSAGKTGPTDIPLLVLVPKSKNCKIL